LDDSKHYSKTNYLLINKDPRKTVKDKFQLKIWDNIVNKCESVKYLELYIDQNISWNIRKITHVSNQQIAKCTRIFYRLNSIQFKWFICT